MKHIESWRGVGGVKKKTCVSSMKRQLVRLQYLLLGVLVILISITSGFYCRYANKFISWVSLETRIRDTQRTRRHRDLCLCLNTVCRNKQLKIEDKIKQAIRRNRNKANKQKFNTMLLARDNPEDNAIEALRSLRTSLHFAMMEAKNKIVMISGPSPEVGKNLRHFKFSGCVSTNRHESPNY